MGRLKLDPAIAFTCICRWEKMLVRQELGARSQKLEGKGEELSLHSPPTSSLILRSELCFEQTPAGWLRPTAQKVTPYSLN